MEDLFIPVILGTTRSGRRSASVADFIFKIMDKKPELRTQLLDTKEILAERKDYEEIAKKADGFFIVMPEYNHGFPGSLKRVLDFKLDHCTHKPVALAGVSSGPWGGTRAIQNILPVVRELGLVATFTDVHFPYVQDLFDDNGEIQEKAYIHRVNESLAELVWMATVLKHGREQV